MCYQKYNLSSRINAAWELRLALYTAGSSLRDPAGTEAFFIYDLVDTLNNSMNGLVSFKEGHIYHFAPVEQYSSYSNICILFHGKLVFFKAINCKKGINSINQVIAYLKQNLKNSPDFDGILSRTANYRHFGRYFKVDSSACFCEY